MLALFAIAAASIAAPRPKAVYEPSPTNCFFCKTAVGLVKKYIEEEKNVQAIIEKLESFCSYVTEDVRPICKQLVEEKVPQIIQWIDSGLDATKICKSLDLCD